MLPGFVSRMENYDKKVLIIGGLISSLMSFYLLDFLKEEFPDFSQPTHLLNMESRILLYLR